MNGNIKAALAVTTLSLVMIVGCDKKFNLTFVNGTAQEREIVLHTPAGTESGIAGPSGGKWKITVVLVKDDLPARCSWQSGEMGGNFDLTEKTKKDIFIHIDRTGPIGPVDKNAEIHKSDHKEREKVVDQEEVVE
jgi:hypothetical protein